MCLADSGCSPDDANYTLFKKEVPQDAGGFKDLSAHADNRLTPPAPLTPQECSIISQTRVLIRPE